VSAPTGFEDLAGELDALAPRFGRARSAVERLASVARQGDPKGICRAGRQVAEEIALGLAAGADSDAPREAGLDALLDRLDAGATRFPVPSHARAHLDALRRPGGVSDRAGPEDAFAALAAAIALLRWYARANPETVVTVAAPRRARGTRGRAPARAAVAVAVALFLLAVAAAVLLAG
jgi:hypothetical protein